MMKKNVKLDALYIPTPAEQAKNKEPRILTLDIETSPHLAWTYQLWNTNIPPERIVEPSRMLCFAAKWFGHKKVQYFAESEIGHANMVRAARDLLDAADIVVTYNGIKFDEKHLQREFIEAGLTPPSPYKSIDLYRTVASTFKFPSNRLGQVGDSLQIGTKVETGGWKLWAGVLDGDDKALRLMKKYNIQDVVLTENLLVALGPWVKGLPHRGVWTGNLEGCYACGSDNLERDGIAFTTVTVYPRYRCADCGAWNKTLRSGQTRAV
jgi:hypothetical protein